MIGIQRLAKYVPTGRIDNQEHLARLETDPVFLKDKIGILKRAVKDSGDDTSDLCVKAFGELNRQGTVDPKALQAVIVVTQNPDYPLPHTSAIVCHKLGAPSNCAAFDISLGCSGFVYGLSTILSFMKENGLERGILFTADPYSKVLDENDKNTALIFGDAASACLIGKDPLYSARKFSFGTVGAEHESLIVRKGKLEMNGRNIFNFVAEYIPRDIEKLLKDTGLDRDRIDRFIFHPGSKFVVDTLVRRGRLDRAKVPFTIQEYGNTVSSSIPILLQDEIEDPAVKTLFLSGFGVGLSWGSAILERA